MDQQILERFVRWGMEEERLHAVLLIGSRVRGDHPADAYSDFDLVAIVENPEAFLRTDEWVSQLGSYHISFTEDTIGGAKERRILFDQGQDVDFVFLSQGSISEDALALLRSGYRVLIDKIGLASMLPPVGSTPGALPSKGEFDNLVQDFWYHSVWTAKKLLRGELWTAKSCLDSYMKGRLLSLLTYHARALHGPDYNTWHSGRFLEEWAEDWVVRRLSSCFARYEQGDMKKALFATMELFRAVAMETGKKLGYEYPTSADAFAARWVTEALADWA